MNEREHDDSKQCSEASFSSSFEVYAAIGGDPDIDQVGDLFTAASKAVLDIKDESNRTRTRPTRWSTRRTVSDTKTEIATEVDVIDSEKLDIYCSSEDDIRFFAIVVNILVSSSNGDLSKAITKAENLAFAAELAFTNGEFEEKIKCVEGSISVLLLEMAPESSLDDHVLDGEEEDDDYDNSSSMYSDEFDAFLEISYREYLQDQNRQEILSRLEPPTSPSAVSEFPLECSKAQSKPPYTINLEADMKTRKEQKVKFDPVVRVKNTLSRYDMTPNESYNYWSGEDEFMTIEQRDRMLKVLTDKWTNEREQVYQEQTKGELDVLSSSLQIPVLPSIKQLLPATECEGHHEYTYTISIRD